MRAWALIAAATAEVSAVAGLATLRGVWMKEINGGTTVHLGLAASLHALLQVFGAALLPVIMLRSSFTTATRLFLFLHASFLLILASCVGTDLPSFYLTHALTGLVSCAAETLLNWTLLTSRDPNEQLEDFANFHKVYDVGTLLGAGVCATVFITYELWVYNMTGTGTANCSSQLGIRAVLGVHGIIMMLSFIGQFSAPVPSNCVAVRGYTYEDLMDALNLSKNLEEKAATEDEIEKTNEQEKRRVSLHAGMPILKVEDGKTIARHPTGRFQPQPTTSGVRPVADRTIFDRDNEDEYDYTDSYGEDDDSLDDNRYFSSSTDGLSQASVRSDPDVHLLLCSFVAVSMGSSDHTSCHSSWTPRECAVNATKFDGGQERMHCPAAEVKQTPIISNDAPVHVELVYDYSRDYTENNIPKTDTAEGVGPIEAGSVNFDHFATFFSPGASTELQGDHETDSKYHKYGGLKQAPLEFKAHDEKRKERAEIRGGKDLHLFYYSFSANAHICFTTKEVTERVGNIWIERHMITIPQLDFLPLKSYNKEMLTDDALKSSVAVVRETRAAVRKGPESVLSTNALRVWPVFFSAAVFYITTLIYTLFLFHQMHVLESSAGLSSLVALGCFVVSFLLSSSSRISFRHSSQGHAVYYIMGSIFQIGVLFAMGFTTDRATVVTLMLICCGGAGMSMPAGVKAGTKMVPVMMQLQQFDSQLCSAHIVRILSPTITVAVSFTVTSTTFWLRPRAWAFDVSTVTEECGRRLSASPTKTADGLEDASETSPKNLAPEPRVGAADANGDPAEVIHTKITRVQQAIKDLTDIGEKPAVLPGCVPDADEAADGEASPVFWGQIVKSLDGHASPLRAFSRQRASRT
uniref:Transmembrane protein n=1 Tax=Toxoplasma gondii (strain ATCC 50861 / VEG) TaxID=432359 RepID=A0A0F7V3P6_TOXGV|nr:TPA: hypothetical protein BN1205_030480 [Toxoplasma gondii VEG]